MLKILILGGDGSYGNLLYRLVRRFSDAEVVIYEPGRRVDGKKYVSLASAADSDAAIFAVPMDSFDQSVCDLLAVDGLRNDMIFVNVCSEQGKSGYTLGALATRRPQFDVHTPWGPEAYRDVNEIVSLLPAMVLTNSRYISDDTKAAIIRYVEERGFKVNQTMSAREHDDTLAGLWMFVAHLVTQIFEKMGLFDVDCSSAPLSFQKMIAAARMLRCDKPLFFNLWDRVPKCHETYDRFMSAVRGLVAEMREHVAAK